MTNGHDLKEGALINGQNVLSIPTRTYTEHTLMKMGNKSEITVISILTVKELRK